MYKECNNKDNIKINSEIIFSLNQYRYNIFEAGYIDNMITHDNYIGTAVLNLIPPLKNRYRKYKILTLNHEQERPRFSYIIYIV